jgi:hypothetical protein
MVDVNFNGALPCQFFVFALYGLCICYQYYENCQSAMISRRKLGGRRGRSPASVGWMASIPATQRSTSLAGVAEVVERDGRVGVRVRVVRSPTWRVDGRKTEFMGLSATLGWSWTAPMPVALQVLAPLGIPSVGRYTFQALARVHDAVLRHEPLRGGRVGQRVRQVVLARHVAVRVGEAAALQEDHERVLRQRRRPHDDVVVA